MSDVDPMDLDATSPGAAGSPHPTPQGDSATPEVQIDEAEKAAVKEWTKKIQNAKVHFEKPFKRMAECQTIANEGRHKDWPETNYTVPVLKRHINVSVSALYARNPTATAKRRKKVQYKLWDGNY